MENFIWQTQVGFYSTEAGGFVQDPTEYTPLYMRDSSGNLSLADIDFLRRTLVFYGFQVPFEIMADKDKYMAEREAIRQKYESPLDGAKEGIMYTLQKTYTAANIKEKDSQVLADIKAQYLAAEAEQRAEYEALDMKYGVTNGQ